MPRLKANDWLKARAFFEAGASQSATAEKFGVSRKAVQLKIEAEGWTQDFEDRIKRRVSEKLAAAALENTPNGGKETRKTRNQNSQESRAKLAEGDPKKTAEAIDAEATRRVKVSERHVKLAEQATQLQQQALGRRDGSNTLDPDFDMQKSAKINAETVQILISLERKIHRLEEVQPTAEPTKIVFARYDDEE